MTMNKIRILVVEDERIVSLDIERRLKNLGYEIVGAAVSGEEAIQKASTHQPDLVLMDIMLEGKMDGITAAETIRRRLAIPVIYLTAHADAHTLERAKITEPFGYILKPFEERELHGHIEIALYKHRMELRLKESEERYMLAARGANDGLWDWDLHTQRIYFSPRWKAMLGFTDNEIGQHPREWFSRLHPGDSSRVKRQLAAHLKGASPHFESEYRILCSDGSYRWMLTRGMALLSSSGKPDRLAGSQTDITERKIYDPLTGLPTRTLFIDRVQTAMDRNRRNIESGFAVLSLSLDDLKLVVNGCGYSDRDHVLTQVARRLQQVLQSDDTAARFGEDHFGILLGDIRSAAAARAIAGHIQEQLIRPFHVDGQEFYLRISIGIALSASNYTTAEDTLRDADTAMQRAKASGTNQIEIFDEKMRSHVAVRIQRERELRRAIEREEFRVYYQPIIALNTGKIAGFEALVRWQSGSDLLLPKDFVPFAEQTGLIIPIEKFVLRQALQQMRIWSKTSPFHTGLSLSVNISAGHYSDPNLVDEIERILGAIGVDPERLKLEITETALMDNKEGVFNTLTRLDDLHIHLAMDDFGTGYSCLSYLHQFPIRTLKIDRCFVSKLGLKNQSRKIVQTIVSLGKNLGMEVTAEGVENTRQIIELQAFDCTYGQGFLFSRPVSSEQATELLVQNIPLFQDTENGVETVFG
jgi:diguanylate cyclase (GGDEF)-like protein/PAS domain S-box-containing protein